MRGAAYIICVCGRYFDVTLSETYNDGKNIEITITEYDDVSRYKKIREETEVVEVGHIDVSKFRKLWEQTWEQVRENIVRNHLTEHGIMAQRGEMESEHE